MTTPKLLLPELSVGQSGKEITHNAALSIIDQAVDRFIRDKDLSTPPGSPSDGDAYIVGASPTGAWAGKAGQVAYWRSDSAIWSFCPPTKSWRAWVDDEAVFYTYKTGSWTIEPSYSATGAQCIPIACSDETTVLTTGTNKVTFRMPYAFTITEVRASLTAAQTSGSIFTVDINESGTSILSTKLTIDNAEKTSTTAATLPVVSDTSIADDAEITIDIDQVGSGTAAGLKVYLIGVKT